MRTLLFLALALRVAGCAPPDDDDSAGEPPTAAADDDDTPDDVLDPTWSELHPLLLFRCTCHRTNEGGDGGLTGLESKDTGYANLVGHPSEDVPGLARIEPFDPAASYVWGKVTSTHLGMGGAGRRMPPTGPALPTAQLEVLRTWIELGAPDD